MTVFKSDTVSVTHDIALVYFPQAGNGIITLVDNNPDHIKYKYGLQGTKGVSNALLDELRCYATISSLPEILFPNYESDDTESERITKVQSYEYATARFEATIYRKAKNQFEWAEVGLVALKNAGGFRYRIHRLLDLLTDNIGARLGENGKIGIAVKSVGYGSPQSYDRISFTGSWVQEYTWTSELPPAVIVNNYGSSSNSPSPSPSPTPTPVVVPSLTLALVQGKTNAIAGTDSIFLSIANIPNGSELSGTWFKNGVDTTVAETVTTTGGAISLNTTKLKSSGAGNYKLRLFYQGNGYTSNEVAVIVNPEIAISLPSGVTTALTGEGTVISIAGNYFTTSATYEWFKDGVSTALTGTLVPSSNGQISTTQNASQFANKGGGNYTLKVTINGVSYTTNAIAVQVTQAPTVDVYPTTVEITYANYNLDCNLRGFTQGETVTTTWYKANTALTSTTTQRTVNNAQYSSSGNYFTFTTPNTTFTSSGVGDYQLRVSRANGQTLTSNTITAIYGEPPSY